VTNSLAYYYREFIKEGTRVLFFKEKNNKTFDFKEFLEIMRKIMLLI
jgi:hypothetical protein